MKREIVVIGGGMAGTSAARVLVAQGHAVTIIEKDSRLGGRICSADIEGLTSEMGAGFLTDIYTNMLTFLKEIGLSDKLLERKSKASIVRDGKEHSLLDLSTMLGGSWLSFGAKMRLVGEVLTVLAAWRHLDEHDMWRAERYDTQSIEQRFKSKYGRELVDYLISPAIDSYLYWSPKTTSRAIAMALLKAGMIQRHTYILKDGLRQIPHAAAQGSNILLSCEVSGVQKKPDGKYEIIVKSSNAKRTLYADGVVCATTASVVPSIINDLTPQQKVFFSSVHYSSTAVATYKLPRTGKPNTRAIAYPRKESLPLTAMTVLSDLSPNADAIKLYASGAIGKELCSQPDADIERTLSNAAKLDVEAARKKGDWRVQKWHEALPEFDVGHLKRLTKFVNGEIENKQDAIVFAGDYIGGPFMEGAFTSGVRAAERLIAKLN